MAQTVIVDVVPAAVPRTPGVPGISHRTARVGLQTLCLAAVLVAPMVHATPLTALLLAQLLCGGGTYLVLRTLRPRHAVTGTIRTWGVAAAISAVSASLLLQTDHADLARAQLVAAVGVLLLAGAGRLRDAWNDAGSQLDAVLATLPPEGASSDSR